MLDEPMNCPYCGEIIEGRAAFGRHLWSHEEHRKKWIKGMKNVGIARYKAVVEIMEKEET